MLRITIELLVHGDESKKKTLGVAEIWNNLSGNLSGGNYNFRIFKKGSSKTIWKSGEYIENILSGEF
jgi:hypothetical protein